MPYKIEVPVPNDILTDSALSRFIDVLDQYKENISSIYLPIGHIDNNIDLWGIRAPTFVYNENGKENKPNIQQWESSIAEVASYTGIPIKLLMNNLYSRDLHTPDTLKKIQAKLAYYTAKFSIKSVTLADFSVIPIAQSLGVPLSLSTNSHNSLSDLDMIFEFYGVDAFESFVVQRDLNRNPEKLMRFLTRRSIVEKAVLMVNEGCINSCPFKQSGDIEIGLSDIKSKSNVIHAHGCTALSQKMPWTFLTSPFLTKDMLDRYYPQIQTIKLAGRDLPVSNIKHQLSHYVTGKDVLLEKILNVFPKKTSISTSHLGDSNYTKMVMSCDKECSICRYCETFTNTLTEDIKNEI